MEMLLDTYKIQHGKVPVNVYLKIGEDRVFVNFTTKRGFTGVVHFPVQDCETILRDDDFKRHLVIEAYISLITQTKGFLYKRDEEVISWERH